MTSFGVRLMDPLCAELIEPAPASVARELLEGIGVLGDPAMPGCEAPVEDDDEESVGEAACANPMADIRAMLAMKLVLSFTIVSPSTVIVECDSAARECWTHASKQDTVPGVRTCNIGAIAIPMHVQHVKSPACCCVLHGQ